MEHKRIAFLGGGNMAEAVLAGLLRAGHPPSSIIVSEILPSRADYLISRYHVPVTSCNSEAASNAPFLVLAVKPLYVPQVLREVCDAVRQNNATVLSIAAGVRVSDMRRWLGGSQEEGEKGYVPKVVRCMPNTPALVACGATGVYAGEGVGEEGKRDVEMVLKEVSQVVEWVKEEKLLDAVTAVSGSGPAYFFMLMEQMSDAGVAAGLSREMADRLTIQTCFGAAKMAQLGEDGFAELRRKVTSPNGTTYAALMYMEKYNVQKRIEEAVVKAAERSEELGDELSRMSVNKED